MQGRRVSRYETYRDTRGHGSVPTGASRRPAAHCVRCSKTACIDVLAVEFKDDAKLDTSEVEDVRGSGRMSSVPGGGLAVGGGAAGFVITLVVLLLNGRSRRWRRRPRRSRFARESDCGWRRSRSEQPDRSRLPHRCRREPARGQIVMTFTSDAAQRDRPRNSGEQKRASKTKVNLVAPTARRLPQWSVRAVIAAWVAPESRECHPAGTAVGTRGPPDVAST